MSSASPSRESSTGITPPRAPWMPPLTDAEIEAREAPAKADDATPKPRRGRGK